MKSLKLFLSLLLTTSFLHTYAQGVMIYRGGDFEYYAASDVDSMVFVTDEPIIELLEGQKFMDLGLPSGTLWATCNIGASSPEQHGWYFAWGETTVKSYYSRDNYSLVSAGNTRNLRNDEDIALLTLGGKWHMPTEADFIELMEECQWSWEKFHNTQGCRVTGPNGKSIFLPAASFKDDYWNEKVDTALYGSYWGRTFNRTTEDNIPCGTELTFGIVGTSSGWMERDFYYEFGPTGYCYCGRSIRPVYSDNTVSDDYTHFIVNPNYNNNYYGGWEGTPLSGASPKNNAEHYNKTYNTYQTISGLTAGKYKVGVQGFYRRGFASNDYALWVAGNTKYDYAMLYAYSAKGNYSVPLAVASSAALSYGLGGSVSEVVNEYTGEYKYIPNNMEAAAYWTEAGYYQNELIVEVGTDGILTIGIKKDQTIEGDWTLIDNWTLMRVKE